MTVNKIRQIILAAITMLLCVAAAGHGSTVSAAPTPEPTVLRLGDERSELYLPLLQGKRTAVFSNQTGIVGNKYSGLGDTSANIDASLIPFGKNAAGNDVTYGKHIVDQLVDQNVSVTAIFSSRHRRR